MKKFDVIIIGSGLGGLECGSILSKEGMDVCILEQHSQIGGCLQNFTRNSCVFDTGIHYIGGLDDGQPLNRYFKYFGLMDNIDLQRMDNDAFDVIRFANDPVEYKYAMGQEHFVETLAQQFPKELKALDIYVKKLQKICHHFPLYNLEYKAAGTAELSHISENAFETIKGITQDEKLQNVLSATLMNYAGVAKKTPFYVHALVNNSFIDSAWRVVNGSEQIANSLASGILKNGGTILNNSKVERFVFENNKLTGVELSNGKIFYAKNFISGIHPAHTMAMIEGKHLRKAYRERIMNLENTISNFCLYIVFKENAFKYINHNEHFFKKNDVWKSSVADTKEWPGHFMFITPATSKLQQYADNAIVMTTMNFDEVKKWENTTVDNRGEDYLQFKEEKTNQLLDLVEVRYPGFRNSIKKVYNSSPLTYRDYTGTVEGSLYGIVKNCNEPLKTLVSAKTKIPNLFLTGQNIILHGVLGVTIGAVTTCSELVGLKHLVKQINNAG